MCTNTDYTCICTQIILVSHKKYTHNDLTDKREEKLLTLLVDGKKPKMHMSNRSKSEMDE